MRLAWIGTPSNDGGVGGMCRLFLQELCRLPLELDVYANCPLEALPELRGTFDGTDKRYLPFLYSWDWNAWYGQNRRAAFVMSFVKRLPVHGRVVEALMKEHRRRPYDAVIQFSQGELFSLGRHVEEVPVILYPCVHAAGELYWCRREEALARRCEAAWWRLIRDQYLVYRARLQRRDYRRARGVIGMSRRFNACVRRDYEVPTQRQGVVYQPIDVHAQRAVAEAVLPPNRPVRLLFVGRTSVRKGVEFLIEAARRAVTGDSCVEYTIIGAGSLWSNYEPLLQDLPSERCRWLKSLPNEQVAAEMQRSDILLIPSMYEPGGIVVAEALAKGMIIVASDAVGSAENLSDSVCYEFAAGNLPDFCDAIARAVQAVRRQPEELRARAVQTARDMFDPGAMAQLLLKEVARLLKSSDQKSDAVAVSRK